MRGDTDRVVDSSGGGPPGSVIDKEPSPLGGGTRDGERGAPEGTSPGCGSVGGHTEMPPDAGGSEVGGGKAPAGGAMGSGIGGVADGIGTEEGSGSAGEVG
jgi:hypothetical protein